MKTAAKLNIALVVTIVANLGFFFDSGDDLLRAIFVLPFLAGVYFVFRYSRQIKAEQKAGVSPVPTPTDKRRHNTALLTGLVAGGISGGVYFVYATLPLMGLPVTLLLLLVFLAFIGSLGWYIVRRARSDS